MNNLENFYIEQYIRVCRQSSKKARMYKYTHKINGKYNLLKAMHVNPGREETVAKQHREVKRLLQAACCYNNKAAINKIKMDLIPELVRIDLELMREDKIEKLTEELLGKISKENFGEICNKSMSEIFDAFMDKELGKQLVELVPAKPEMEFIKARQMDRHYIIHCGPTNSGKTYRALLRLKEAKAGVYLGPLRLLALEVFEKMKEYGTPCTMLTGQECIEMENSLVTASTVEMLDIDKVYDIAVIDEAQMVADELRGHSWTRAILGIKAKEIHICMSPDALGVVCHLIELANGSYEIERYERKTPLLLEDNPVNFPDDVREGDALIVFSKKAVLNVAGRLESVGIESSVIYGSLPPEIRRKQMELFNSGKTKVVVSTDAIGMGLNLPVRRIIFMSVEKFDGNTVRALEIPEIKQIAGRAGRYGLYETGYVTAMDERKLNFLKSQWGHEEEEINSVSLGFPNVLMSMDAPLDTILKIWHEKKPSPPFVKIKIDDMLFLYNEAYKIKEFIPDFEDKHILYKMITCPIDIKDLELVGQWKSYCRNYIADIELEHPRTYSKYNGLMKYESYYKKLDLYYQFSVRLGKIVDSDWLWDEREKTQEKIMQLLSKDKHEYILRCKYCGKILPVDYPFRICKQCKIDLDYNRRDYRRRY